MTLCAICGSGRYCWLHDKPARDLARAILAKEGTS